MKEKDLIRSEEVDVNGIFTLIKSFFASIFGGIANLVKFSLNNLVKLTVFSVLGIAIGIGIFFLMKPIYTTHIAISSKRLDNDHCSMLIQTLEDLNDHKENVDVVAQKLNITTEMAREIKNIEFEEYNSKMGKRFKDSVSVYAPFKVLVKVYNNGILDSLEKGIVSYLENNEYALKRKKISEEGLQLLRVDINKEITSLDSLKKIVNKSIVPQSTGTGIILGQPINPVDVYQKAIDLFSNKLNVQEKLALNNSIEVLESFTKFTKPTWPKLWLNILLGAIGGYLLGFIFTYKTGQLKTSFKKK